MAEPILSIAIPAFGYPVSLITNVKRLLKIDRDNIEIVIVDNDASGEQIKGQILEIDDVRLHYYQNESNIGRSNNIIRAIEKSTSDYVLIMSCDDELYPDAVEEIMDIILKFSDIALIMGRIKTNLGNVLFSNIIPGKYKKGYEVLNVLPFLGNLMPFVINKSKILLSEFYDINETYMQNRLILSVANSGDLFFLKQDMGMQIDNLSERTSNVIPEIFIGEADWSSWNTGGCYYAPQNRIMQLQSELEIVNSYQLRGDQKIKIIDKLVSRRIGQFCEYIVGCHDPYLIKSSGSEGFMTYPEIFDIFLTQMESYFSRIEKNKQYFFTGRLHDIINNELLLIEQAEMIMAKLLKNDIVIWECGAKSNRLIGMLGLFDVKIKGMITNGIVSNNNVNIINVNYLSPSDIVLVPDVYREEIEDILKENRVNEYYFMDSMSKYLAVIYCSHHSDEASIKPYLTYYD